jgi:hypothetical protein
LASPFFSSLDPRFDSNEGIANGEAEHLWEEPLYAKKCVIYLVVKTGSSAGSANCARNHRIRVFLRFYQ